MDQFTEERAQRRSRYNELDGKLRGEREVVEGGGSTSPHILPVRGSGSVLDPDSMHDVPRSGSGFTIRIRFQEGKNYP
jgi:hypothetical protein